MSNLLDLLARITKAVRLADRKFEKAGGSSRHWVRECLLPELEAEGLAVVDTSDTWVPIEECGELERGRYLVQLRSGAQIVALCSGDSEGWVLRQRDLDEFDSPRDITHVHQMGPIRGPGETDGNV